MSLTKAEISEIKNSPGYQTALKEWIKSGRLHPAVSVFFCDEEPFRIDRDSSIPVTREMGQRLGLTAHDWYEGKPPDAALPVRWYYLSELVSKIEIPEECAMLVQKDGTQYAIAHSRQQGIQMFSIINL